jgi:predicted ATP-grasp superfamily ATP-dependent carboligase
LADANEFFEKAGTKWCAVDMKRDHDDGKWKVLETTTGWPWGVFTDHVIVGTKRNGLDAWPMLLEDIESGVFG